MFVFLKITIVKSIIFIVLSVIGWYKLHFITGGFHRNHEESACAC